MNEQPTREPDPLKAVLAAIQDALDFSPEGEQPC